MAPAHLITNPRLNGSGTIYLRLKYPTTYVHRTLEDPRAKCATADELYFSSYVQPHTMKHMAKKPRLYEPWCIESRLNADTSSIIARMMHEMTWSKVMTELLRSFDMGFTLLDTHTRAFPKVNYCKKGRGGGWCICNARTLPYGRMCTVRPAYKTVHNHLTETLVAEVESLVQFVSGMEWMPHWTIPTLGPKLDQYMKGWVTHPH